MEIVDGPSFTQQEVVSATTGGNDHINAAVSQQLRYEQGQHDFAHDANAPENPSGNRTRTAPSAAVLRTKFLDNAEVVQNSRLMTALVPLLALGGCSSKAYRK